MIDEVKNQLTVFVLNRNLTDNLSVHCDFRALNLKGAIEHIELAGFAMDAANTANEPNRVFPVSKPIGSSDLGRFDLEIARASWNVFRFSV